ncbi:MAG: dynamin family protein [Synergistaceae bacterium]|jgi:PAS domain-containing protein|nr:dynamin family protein [Synergistaceae bacterium]
MFDGENAQGAKPIWEFILAHTRQGVLDANLQTGKTRCSPSLVQGLSLTPETLPQTLDQWLELYHPDDYPQGQKLRALLFKGRKNSFSLERRLYCGDGKYRWFRLDAVCLRGASGKVERLIGAETDISRAKAVEKELEKLQAMGREQENALIAGREREEKLKEDAARLTEEKERLSEALFQKELNREFLENRLHLTREMLDAASDLLFHWDADGQVTFCNAAFSAALAFDPGVGVRAAEPGPCRYEDAYGRFRLLAARSLPFINRFGEEEGLIVAASDVTEVAEIEKDMTRLRRRLGLASLASRSPHVEPAEPEKTHGGEAISKAVEKWLSRALEALSVVSGLFSGRAAQVEALLREEGGREMEVGAVGITSSGKSAFINAMMGERLLPEETRATTNLVIRCRKGEERAVTVIFKDGTRRYVSGAQLTPAWMENMASERLNPANERGLAFLEWTSPGSALPEGLVLLDTPGLDACGLPEHSELLLRRLLPVMDIVFYVTSIRNRLKAPDLELLEVVLEQNQRVIFLISQIDLEQDDLEGGKVVLSRRQKLSSYVSGLRQDVENGVSGVLRDAAVVPVSSKLAMAHFYDRESDAWAASNFGALLGRLKDFRDNLGLCRAETRARRALTLLSRAASDLSLTLGNIPAEKAGAETIVRLEKVHDLRDAQRWANAEISAVRNEWRRLLAPRYHLECLREGIEAAGDIQEIKEAYERWSEKMEELAAKMTARMDRARQACLDILSSRGIEPGVSAAGTPGAGGELPDFYRYVLHETRVARVRGWFEGLEFWPRYETIFHQSVDLEKMFSNAEESLIDRLSFLNGHLSWWENRMREDYCGPLYGELGREEVALADLRRAAKDTSLSRGTLTRAWRGVREAERGVKAVLDSLALPGGDAWAPDVEAFFDALEESPNVFLAETSKPDQGIFAPLLAAFREQDIQSRFLDLKTLRQSRHVVFLGLRQHDALRLLSRLTHDVALSESLRAEDGREIDERDWLFCGDSSPSLPHVRITAPDSLLRELRILIAPGDNLCDLQPADWEELFAEWLPVVHLDVARVDAGLSDLERAPYAQALPLAERWVAASGQGALFNGKLADLLTDVPERVELFARRRDYRGLPEWFVYENYDTRYTDFMAWGREGDAESFLRRWAEEGRDFRYPFTESRLRLALEGARRKGAFLHKAS